MTSQYSQFSEFGSSKQDMESYLLIVYDMVLNPFDVATSCSKNRVQLVFSLYIVITVSIFLYYCLFPRWQHFSLWAMYILKPAQDGVHRLIYIRLNLIIIFKLGRKT